MAGTHSVVAETSPRTAGPSDRSFVTAAGATLSLPWMKVAPVLPIVVSGSSSSLSALPSTSLCSLASSLAHSNATIIRVSSKHVSCLLLATSALVGLVNSNLTFEAQLFWVSSLTLPRGPLGHFPPAGPPQYSIHAAVRAHVRRDDRDWFLHLFFLLDDEYNSSDPVSVIFVITPVINSGLSTGHDTY